MFKPGSPLDNLRYFLGRALAGEFRQILDYHSAQSALYGWLYLAGVRRLRPDGCARYRSRRKWVDYSVEIRKGVAARKGAACPPPPTPRKSSG